MSHSHYKLSWEMLDTCAIVSITARVAETEEKDVHLAIGTFCEREHSLGTICEAIIHTSHFACIAGRHWTEGLELGTVRE